jgi:hypothetical protein
MKFYLNHQTAALIPYYMVSPIFITLFPPNIRLKSFLSKAEKLH